MQVADRLEQALACQVINLTDAERDLYTGAGWKLARFVDGALVEFFDPTLLEYPREYSAQQMAEGAVRTAMAWITNIESGNAAQSYTNGLRDGGEVWLVMCSCGQLCEPRQVSLKDTLSLARTARIFAEQFAD